MFERTAMTAAALAIAAYAGCAESSSTDTAASTSSAGGLGAGVGGDGGRGGDAITVGSGGSGGNVMACDPGLASVDDDLDGFSEDDGDCNDCDANANPNAIEVIAEQGDPADENCDGVADEPPEVCDVGLALESVDPVDAARALGICKAAGEGASWGLVSAGYVNADGTPIMPTLAVGLLPKFGDTLILREGSAMLGLSTGHARDRSQPDFCGTTACSVTPSANIPPPGFPQVVPNCVTSPDIRDDIGLELEVRAPSNAQGYAFDFAFFSFEFPYFVCTAVNDQFVALADPAPAGAINGNIAFDSASNPVSVNLGSFPHCYPAGIGQYAGNCQILSPPCPQVPNPYCPAGPALLSGTGFDIANSDNSGATGWLTTTAPIAPGESVALRFAIWDGADSGVDSTVLIDRFRWLAEPATVVTLPALQ